jgi:rod shape-determining protein MreC
MPRGVRGPEAGPDLLQLAVASGVVALTRRSTRPRFTLLLLVLAAVTIITIAYRGHADSVINSIKGDALDAFAPVQSAVSDVARPIGNFFSGATHYGSLQSENARLRAENSRLQTQALQSADAQSSFQSLLKTLNLPWAQNIPTVPAEVVANSSSNFEVSIQLNKGRDAGIDTGMPVVSGSGLVGRVVVASNSRSTVLLITDPTSNVGVRFGTAGNLAVAAGQGAGAPLRVDLVPPQVPVDKGELMITSGLQQSIYPPGVPIGTVLTTGVPRGSFQQAVTLAPVADLTRLQFVAVMQWAPKS